MHAMHGHALTGRALQIRMLPKTLRVSAVTEEGLEDLKHAVLQLMDATDWATQIQEMQTRDESAFGSAVEFTQ